MSSSSLADVEYVQLADYLAVIAITPIIYDYILILPREIDYIWRRRWTRVSLMYFLARYCGLAFKFINAPLGTTFMPGPPSVSVASCITSYWTYLIFLCASDSVMILRVYAIWDRSKLVLYFLLFIFFVQLVAFVVLGVMYYNSNHILVTIIQIDGYSFCSPTLQNVPSSYNWYTQLPPVCLGAALTALALVRTVQQSVAMYRATKLWQPNRYMQLLLREGILYFLLNVLTNLMSLPVISNTAVVLSIYPFLATAFCVVMPRFIIGMRELYDRDARGRLQVLDTGFGARSQFSSTHCETVSAIAFADTIQGPHESVDDEGEDIGLDVRQKVDSIPGQGDDVDGKKGQV